MSTATEVMNSINGFDELAIEKFFGFDLYSQAEAKPVLAQRAAIFVDLRHGGETDRAAYDRAMGMTISDLSGYFDEEPDEVLPDEPDTEPGKG